MNNFIKSTLFISIFFMLLTSCNKDDDPVIKPVEPEVQIPQEFAIDSTQIFKQIVSGRSEADRLGLRFSFSDFVVTGIYVEPHATLKLKLNLIEGSEFPELLVGSYSRGTHWNTQPDVFYLTSGINEISVGENGGMVYIRYTSNYTPDAKVSIKFLEGWKHTPLFKLNDTSNSTWKKMLSYFDEIPTVTLESDQAFIVVSREKAIEYQEGNQHDLLKAIDEVITVQNDISGMDGSEEIHKPMSHKLMMVEYTGDAYYMFAYNYRTAYRNYDAVQYILEYTNFNNDGWGPWHELGHMHQMNAWTWSEIVETTVNIYSLASEKSRGITTSRYKRENKWAAVNTYLALEDNNRNFNSNAADVWVRLGMFYQLQLAFGDGFYKDLHKLIRKENPLINSDEDRMRTFMISACKVANKDLSDFFKKWGLKFNDVDAVYEEIINLKLTKPTVDLTQLND